MAGYSAVIDVRVQGQDDLRALTDGVGRLNDLIRKVKPVPTLFDKRGTEEVKTLKSELAGLIKAYADGNNRVAKFSTSISGVAQQLSTFRAIAANAKTGTEDFTNALTAAARASTTLLQKELDRFSALQGIYQRQAVGNLSIQDQGPSKLVRDLIALKNTVPNSVSAMERYQRELLDVQNVVSKTSLEYRELGQAIRQVDVILGRGGQLGPVPPPVQGPALPPNFRPPSPTKPTKPAAGGLQGLMEKPGVADALIGGAFPLLFGGGPGATVGGFAGGLVGGTMGGLAGMALSLALSAVGQQLDAAVAKIRDMQKAIDALSVDELRDSFVEVNAELATTIRRLIDAGRYDEARAAAANAVANQTGASSTAIADSAKASAQLGYTWTELVGTISTSVSLLATPFIKALTASLEILNMSVKGWNMIGTSVGSLTQRILGFLIPGYDGVRIIIDKINASMGGVSEEQQKLLASLRAYTDQQRIEISNITRINALEQQRTLGRTTAEKQINASLDSQVAKEQIRQTYEQKALEIRRDYAALGQAEVNKALQQNEQLKNQALRQQAIKDLLVQQGFALDANTEKYARIVAKVENEIAALERANSVRQSGFSAAEALNNLYGAQLERQYRLARTEEQRYAIALQQFRQQVKAAQIEYEQTRANNTLLVQKTALQANLVEIKYKELEAEKQIALAQAGARGNTPAQIGQIGAAYDKALGLQRQAVTAAYEQVNATKTIAENQNVVAEAVYKTKVLQAESTLAQKLASEEIGLSKNLAEQLATQMSAVAVNTIQTKNEGIRLVGTIEIGTAKTRLFARAMGEVSANAQAAAYNIYQAFKNQLELNRARANTPTSGSASTKQAAAGAFWPGGFEAFARGGVVNRPTLGLIGEGGESEYIVPESKAAGFATNYLFGQRGEAAIPSTAAGTDAQAVTPVINITTGPVVEFNGERYVTVADMERAMRMTAEGVIGRLRTPSARIALGIA